VTLSLVVEIAFAAVFVNWMVRSILRIGAVMRWLWKHTQPPELGSGHERPSVRGTRLLAKVVGIYAGRPLRISAFEGGAEGVDAAAVSSALSASMGRVGSLRQSGVDVVTAPVGAGSAIEAVAEAVKGAPAGGETAASLLRLFGWLIARGELQLSGHVLCSKWRGPGIALSLATASGQVLERETIWAGEFEPDVGAENFGAEFEADRLLRVATAGAVWAHFTILRELWHLREPERRALLQTSNWRSYALMRVGAEAEAHCGETLTRALYALAVDADPDNLLAQFDLASMEVRDKPLAQVHNAGLARLSRVHRGLEVGERPEDGDPHVSITELARTTEILEITEQTAKVVAQTTEVVEIVERKEMTDAELLNRDPLHYQVAYKVAATKLDDDTEIEAKSAELRDGSWPSSNGGSLTAHEMAELERHIGELERTLAVLLREDAGEWPAAGSKAWSDMKLLLRSIEGPMLVLWAMVALRIGRPAHAIWSTEALSDPFESDGTAGSRRASLIEQIKHKALTPGEAIGLARSEDVWRTTRTRFNLACWYADVREFPLAMRELELSLESGGLAARRGLDDPQLRDLRTICADEWGVLVSRYAPTTSVHDNGHQPLAQA
jgi:hypothetical protein